MKGVGTVVIQVIMLESQIRVMFGIVRNLVVPALLGTSCIDIFIKGIFPTEGKIAPSTSVTVTILTVHEEEINKTEKQEAENVIIIME